MYLCPTELTLISPPYILFSHLELSPHIWHPQFHFLSCSLRYIYTLTVTFSQAILPLNGRLGFHISSVFTIVGKWAIYIIFFFFLLYHVAYRIFLTRESNPCALHLKFRVLTTGPEKSRKWSNTDAQF